MCGETKKAFDLNFLPEVTPELSQEIAKEERKEPLVVGVQSPTV